MGHLGTGKLYKLQTMCKGIKFNIPLKDLKLVCTICTEANAVKLPHNKIRERATKRLRIIHVAAGGGISPETYDNKNYYLLILDGYTHT